MKVYEQVNLPVYPDTIKETFKFWPLYIVCSIYMYSGTSNNGHSETWTTSVEQKTRMYQLIFLYCYCATDFCDTGTTLYPKQQTKSVSANDCKLYKLISESRQRLKPQARPLLNFEQFVTKRHLVFRFVLSIFAPFWVGSELH